jgi:transposase
MITFNDSRIFIYSRAIDMRKGIDGLCQLLFEQEVKPQCGGLYLFSNKTGRVVKGLIWDRNGFILIYKRIEGGRFKVRFDDNQRATLELTQEQLKWLLAGLDYERLILFPELNLQNIY